MDPSVVGEVMQTYPLGRRIAQNDSCLPATRIGSVAARSARWAARHAIDSRISGDQRVIAGGEAAAG